MKDVLHLLESERETERQFVAGAADEPDFPRGWPAGLLMAHIASWREQLRDGLIQASRGQPVSGPPADIDAFNAAELARSAAISLDEGAARADVLLGDLIDLWATLGDRPFTWFTANTTGEALIRNSYHHPRVHLAEHYVERGDRVSGYRIFEVSVDQLREAGAPPHTLGSAVYNLARARVGQGRLPEALTLLEEAIQMRPDLRSIADDEPDLAPLKKDARFKALLKH